MNIQLYVGKTDNESRKAERFFKERKVSCQVVDLKKHKLGRRELETFARAAGGAKALVDRSTPRALERAVAHMDTESLIFDELLADPAALVSPIVRNGAKATIGVDEAAWKSWLTEGK